MPHKDPEVRKAYRRQYHQAHREEANARRRQWHWDNHEYAIKAMRRRAENDPRYREAVRRAKVRWKQRNPDYRRPRRRDTYNELKEAVVYFLAARDGWKCAHCGCNLSLSTASPDHKVAGVHRLENLQLACRPCNQKDGGRRNRKYYFEEEATA